MPFTDEQMVRIRGAMGRLGGCQVCGNRLWRAYGELVSAQPVDQQRRPLPEHGPPLVMVRCADCGNTAFFDADTLALLPYAE